MDLRNIKVGVLGGGVSPEREVSLLSAKAAHQALLRNKVKAVFVDIDTSQQQDLEKLFSVQALDLAFIALHGKFGEDGGIQSVLEDLNIAYTGSGPQASSLAMNKALAKQKFQKVGIPTPEFKICWESQVLPDDLDYPLVVKPYCSGSSLGVSIVESREQLNAAIAQAFGQQDIILFEEYIVGRELTVGVLDDQALALVEIIPKRNYYDFTAKYDDDLTEFIAPAKLDDKLSRSIKELALAAHRALGCRHFSRVDFRLDQDSQAYVLEVNSIPGLTAHSLLPLSAQACGINFDSLIMKMAELAARRSAAIA